MSMIAQAVQDKDLIPGTTRIRCKSSRVPRDHFIKITKILTSKIKNRKTTSLMEFKRRRIFRDAIVCRKIIVRMPWEMIHRSTDHISHNTPRIFSGSIKTSKFRSKMKADRQLILWLKSLTPLKYKLMKIVQARPKVRYRRIWNQARGSTAKVLRRCTRWTQMSWTLSETTFQFKKIMLRRKLVQPMNIPIMTKIWFTCKSTLHHRDLELWTSMSMSTWRGRSLKRRYRALWGSRKSSS